MKAYEEALKLWAGYDVQTPADLDLRLDNFRVLFAYHSGKIENPEVTLHDTREIFENGRAIGFSGNPRTLFEQQNQKLCYDYLKLLIAARAPLTAELVKEVHGILTAGTYDEHRFIERGERPGAYKKHDFVTGRYEVGSPPGDVEAGLTALIDEVNAYQGDQILKAAAYFHAGFEHIHPFADGNGRVGRTLLNYYLLTHGHPPLIIHDEDKGAYYDALETFDAREDLTPLLDVLKHETVKTWEATLTRQKGEKQPRKKFDDYQR